MGWWKMYDFHKFLVHYHSSDNVNSCLGWITGMILGLHTTNKRRRYFVTPSLIGWAQTYHKCDNNNQV